MQKKWCLGRAKADLEKSVVDNHAGTYGAHPTIPLLTESVSCEPVRGKTWLPSGRTTRQLPWCALRLGRLTKKRSIVVASSPGLCVVIVLET